MKSIFARGCLLCLLPLALSCSSPDETELPLMAPTMTQPVATGIYLTAEQGPEPIGVWGEPSDGLTLNGGGASYLISPPQEGSSALLQYRLDGVVPFPRPSDPLLGHPYPNPSNGAMEFEFSISRKTLVDLWLVPARWRGDKSRDVSSSSGGAVTVAPRRIASFELLRDRQVQPGMYRITLSTLTDDAVPMPAGFYRLYMRTGDAIYWRDILIYHNDADLPTDLHTQY